MFYLPGWTGSYMCGALWTKFQPDVLNPFVLICGCLLYIKLQAQKKKCFLEGINRANCLAWNRSFQYKVVLIWTSSGEIAQKFCSLQARKTFWLNILCSLSQGCETIYTWTEYTYIKTTGNLYHNNNSDYRCMM